MRFSIQHSVRVVSLAMLLACGGCGASLLSSDAIGPSTVSAEFVLPKEPTLVLVEDYRTAAGGDVNSDRLGHLVGQELTVNNVAPLVDAGALSDLRDRDPQGYRKMTVADIGRAVAAKQVVYVSVNDYGTEAPIAGDMVKYRASVKVKVVDSQTGASRWPQDLADGEPVIAETNYKELDPDKADIPIREEMDKLLALRIGRLFHSWQKASDEGEEYLQQ